MLKYYFPSYKNKLCFSARLLFFPYSQQLEEPRKIGFGGMPIKLVKADAKRALDFFAHAHIFMFLRTPDLIKRSEFAHLVSIFF